jgi:hypothetical protein
MPSEISTRAFANNYSLRAGCELLINQHVKEISK